MHDCLQNRTSDSPSETDNTMAISKKISVMVNESNYVAITLDNVLLKSNCINFAKRMYILATP